MIYVFLGILLFGLGTVTDVSEYLIAGALLFIAFEVWRIRNDERGEV